MHEISLGTSLQENYQSICANNRWSLHDYVYRTDLGAVCAAALVDAFMVISAAI